MFMVDSVFHDLADGFLRNASCFVFVDGSVHAPQVPSGLQDEDEAFVAWFDSLLEDSGTVEANREEVRTAPGAQLGGSHESRKSITFHF